MGRQLDERLVFLATCHHIYSVIIMNVLICGKYIDDDDDVNPLDRNSWRTSVRHCQVLPTPESWTTAAPSANTKTGHDDDDDDDVRSAFNRFLLR